MTHNSLLSAPAPLVSLLSVVGVALLCAGFVSEGLEPPAPDILSAMGKAFWRLAGNSLCAAVSFGALCALPTIRPRHLSWWLTVLLAVPTLSAATASLVQVIQAEQLFVATSVSTIAAVVVFASARPTVKAWLIFWCTCIVLWPVMIVARFALE